METALRQDSIVSPRAVLRELVDQELNKISVMDITLVLGDLPIATAFQDHSDPIIRFIANIYLLKSGRLDASKRLNDLIDDDSLSEFDARYLKTRFASIGVDVENATAAEIAKHFAIISIEFPAMSKGAEIPDTELSDVQGRKFKLSDFRGKTVLIHYWATWCIPCMDEIDSLSKRLESLDKEKYVVLLVSLDVDMDAHTKRIESLSKKFIFVCDGKSARGPLTSLFSVIHIPVNVIISPEGKLASTKLSDTFPNESNIKAP